VLTADVLTGPRMAGCRGAPAHERRGLKVVPLGRKPSSNLTLDPFGQGFGDRRHLVDFACDNFEEVALGRAVILCAL